jgi:conjugal transfer/entry exclusion protein
MNHNVTMAIVAIVVATALTAVAFAIPQQALAYRQHHNHNGNSLKVDQQINQLNNCTTSALCVNVADNSAHIHK